MAEHAVSAFVLVVLAACAARETREAPATRAPSPAPTFAAQPALDRWIASLRTESPECAITVKLLVADEAQVTFEPMHPIATPDEPPRQIPTVHDLFVQPFVEDADVVARRDAQQKRVDACIADAGPGPHHKGRDMHVETCAITSSEGPPIPTAHLDRDFSVYLPAYFQPPAECEKAAAALRARLTSYR